MEVGDVVAAADVVAAVVAGMEAVVEPAAQVEAARVAQEACKHLKIKRNVL